MKNDKKMTPAEFVKYAAKNHIKFSLPEDNRTFPCQKCQDEQLTYSFRRLHVEVVNLIIKWCKDNNVNIDEFYLDADGLKDSIPTGEWQACTDSGFSMQSVPDEEYRKIYWDFDKEFYESLSQKQISEIKRRNHEPYLFSM